MRTTVKLWLYVLVTLFTTCLSAAEKRSRQNAVNPTVQVSKTVAFADSEWTIESFRTTERIKGVFDSKRAEPDATFYVIYFKVRNLSKRNDPILIAPKLRDSDGNLFDPLDDEDEYVTEGRKTITTESINPKLTKLFCSIFEVPKASKSLSFGARSLSDDKDVKYVPLFEATPSKKLDLKTSPEESLRDQISRLLPEAEKGKFSDVVAIGPLYDALGMNSEAFRWYAKGAEMGDHNCAFNLGLCYEAGKGTSVNFQEAYAWFIIAEKSYGNIPEMSALGKRMTPNEIAGAWGRATAISAKLRDNKGAIATKKGAKTPAESSPKFTGSDSSPSAAPNDSLEESYYRSLLENVRLEFKSPPHHPKLTPGALKTGITVVVNSDGSLSRPRITSSCGDNAYDEAVIFAIRRVKMPPHPNGKTEEVSFIFTHSQ